MPNRLQHETSPYLLQHQDNPVDWYPWGDEAFELARSQDKPILLSVGYSACHWCHVMAHESFESAQTADMMNEMFVNIKVDREERPDVDDIYMGAVQAMTGRGGWPMTVFMLPDGRPFYGGTYYPPEDRYGMPGFRRVLVSVHDAYVNRRDEIERMASDLTSALHRDVLGIGGSEADLNERLLDNALKKMLANFEPRHGGLSDAPKFPQPMNFEYLLRAYQRTKDEDALHAVTYSLEKMARGGIYDQLGGGFARYSTDALWLVPHFEKMLYDNAQLSRLYLHAWQITDNPYFRRIAEETYDYILREMTAPEGGFYSATDADSEGEEGKFFVWSIGEMAELLSEDDAKIAVEYWGMSRRGNFEGQNILHVPNDDSVVAERLGISEDHLRERLTAIKDTLYAARTHRVHPGLDDKILTSWNGMMLASLAEAARILARDDYRIAAERAGDFLLSNLVVDEVHVHRTYKDGQARLNGYLEDYANLIDALLELYQTTFDDRWFVAARRLADHALDQFGADEGGFFDTSTQHEALIVRPRNVQDNAVPSGSGMMTTQLVRLAAYTGDSRYDEAARRALKLLSNAIEQVPSAFGQSACALEMLVSGVQELALVGDPETDAMRDLLNLTRTAYRPNLIVALSKEDVRDEHPAIPLLSYRLKRGGAPTAYVCEHFVCQMPVTTADDLSRLLV